MISFAVELRVRQHQADASFLGSRVDDRWQIRAIVPRTAPCELRQHELVIQVHQPPPTSASAATAAVSARDNACAARKTCLPHLAPNRWRPRRREPAFRFWRSEPRNRRTVSPTARSMVWSSRRCKKRYRVVKSGTLTRPSTLAQLAVFAQTHFGFTKSPVFVTHQAENGQQLRLGKLPFAETASVAGEHHALNCQSDAGEREESNFGHRTSCLHRKPRSGSHAASNFKEIARMSNRAR